jgi:isopenicillin N synthase-like dioxygenase
MDLYPAAAGFCEVLLAYIDEVTAVGQLLLCGIAVRLGTELDYFSIATPSTPRLCCFAGGARARNRAGSNNGFAG